MTKYKESIAENRLRAMFPEEWLRNTAKETGLIKRERKIDPVIIFWVLTLGFGVRLQRSLASLKRQYEKDSAETISDSSWYYRFTPELVKFLQLCVIHGIEDLAKEPNRKLTDKLDTFNDVLIQDSTIIRLHKSLSEKFPAARSRNVAAGIKVSVLVSAISDGPKKVALYGERTAESKTLRVGPWVKDRVILLDLGFYKHHMFAKISENGGYFVSRLKGNVNPVIVSINGDDSGDELQDIMGKPVRDILPRLEGERLDAIVEIPFKRRAYRGKQKQDTMNFRLVAIFNEDEQKYHLYLTNIQKDVLDSKDIATLYGARWDIELLFKELKSKYALDILESKKEQIIEAYIWISILTLLISRRIYCLVRDANPGKKMVRYTQLRWGTIFAETASDLLTSVLNSCGFDKTFETIMEVYDSQALDPHINRERFRSEWWA